MSNLPFDIPASSTTAAAYERRKARREEREDAEHLKRVRNLPCYVCELEGRRGCGRVDPHHEPPVGTRTKWHDRKTYPLGRRHHNERHRKNRRRFESEHGFTAQSAIERTIRRIQDDE